MSKYVNIGNKDFQFVRNDTYVDKSKLIVYMNQVLNTTRKYLCVTRARRFGKSIAAKMLNAYYDESVDSRYLFNDLQIAKDLSYNVHINKYSVIYLDVTEFTTKSSIRMDNVLEAMDRAIRNEVYNIYQNVIKDINDDLPDMLLKVVETTDKQFIMIVDEWDAICREIPNEDIVRQYVDWLRSLFKTSVSDRIFAGVYMTGILPIKQYNTQSALNNFEEFSMINPGPLAGYFGFTKEEVHSLTVQYEMNEDEIQKWYDGYQIGNQTEIFNPYAVMRAVQRHSIETYWTATGAYEGLLQYITMNFDGLRDAVVKLLIGESVKVNVMRFSNDMYEINSRDAVLTLLIHLGYLSYNREFQTVSIPNYEVHCEFERAIKDSNWKYIARTIQNSEQLLNDTLAGNEQAVAEAIELVHQDNTSILQYNDENALSYVVSLAYQAAHRDYEFVREMPTGKGFADIVLVPRHNVEKPAIVIELKFNKSPEDAIQQIKNNHYANALQNYTGNIVLVGINYDKKKKHSCKIEQLLYRNNIKIGQRNRSEKIGQRVADNVEKVFMMIKGKPEITRNELSAALNVAPSSIQRYINILKQSRIRRLGSDTKGSWEILEGK